MPSYEKTITLPSKGLFYDGKLPGGEVEIRAMTTQEEKLLAAGGSGMKMIETIFKRCANLPEGLPAIKMLVMDRFSLLMHIRIASYGPSYQIGFNCSECKKLNYTDVDLEQDVIAEEDCLEEGAEETYEVELPVSGKTLTMIHPTGDDEAAADKHGKKASHRRGVPSDLQEFRLARQITQIDGVPANSILETMAFIRSMHTRDNVAVRDAVQDNNFGIASLEFDFECEKCGAEQAPMTLPMGEDFFRVVSPRG